LPVRRDLRRRSIRPETYTTPQPARATRDATSSIQRVRLSGGIDRESIPVRFNSRLGDPARTLGRRKLRLALVIAHDQGTRRYGIRAAVEAATAAVLGRLRRLPPSISTGNSCGSGCRRGRRRWSASFFRGSADAAVRLRRSSRRGTCDRAPSAVHLEP
jgi:hypothetical protein